MNNDLISRNALMELARNHIGRTVDCNDIARVPAMDAEPVRHGRWILLGRSFPTTDYTYTTSALYMCSECGLRATKQYPYCHCGAKMDAEA